MEDNSETDQVELCRQAFKIYDETESGTIPKTVSRLQNMLRLI